MLETHPTETNETRRVCTQQARTKSFARKGMKRVGWNDSKLPKGD